ncbi:amino acid adenylation domain-containing protein [Granulicella tundricola]|uniref:Amino acid adenylation domain protein n=1 Tax=Granulicella tundricola (strain ATCC BAA-1859 / DSM 23138 / MP5ACTX9) TaxID=1198114 RepID=E8X007_GRATM|nr:amino acid adenylation domain-containing protein [Granulicella tundricola]ADW68903.1 amino acid adenylation domain protein [Granulicella tundricola MP5ACTX9]
MTQLNAVRDEEMKVAVGGSLGSLFEQARMRHGARVAVSMGADAVTYEALGARADAVAAGLARRGVGRGAVVAILMERSVDLVAAMLGVVKAGAAYLPIDPAYPEARVAETLADARPMVVIGKGGVSVEELAAGAGGEVAGEGAGAEDLAYIIYTSGSTGKPKGVMVSHGNVARLFSATDGWFHFDENDVWTMFHSFSFDFSVWEMWGPLLTGGRLVIVPFGVSRSPEDFYALLADEGVTVLNQTPSAFNLLVQAEGRVGRKPLALRTVIFGGEALNLRALKPWFERHGDQRPELVNMYGITETTVHVTYRRITAEDAERETDSLIGEAIPDLQLHLLDGELKPVAVGETGEICVGGAGVALGYLNRAELTAERFVDDPFVSGGVSGAKMYRSGDLAKRREDGELVYMGRADRQVKVNGFRIELGEIEAALVEFAGVAQACVVPLMGDGGVQRLAAYFVAASVDVDAKTVSKWLAERLPVHMRPAFYTAVTGIPLNGNGKVDRDALPLPEAMTSSLPDAPRLAPGSSMEEHVAAIWRQVLKTQAVGMDDNFFDIGGSSLMLIGVRSALAEELKRAIPITWMFECTTVRTLAARLGAGRETVTADAGNAADKARRQRDSFARAKALRSVAR